MLELVNRVALTDKEVVTPTDFINQLFIDESPRKRRAIVLSDNGDEIMNTPTPPPRTFALKTTCALITATAPANTITMLSGKIFRKLSGLFSEQTRQLVIILLDFGLVVSYGDPVHKITLYLAIK